MVDPNTDNKGDNSTTNWQSMTEKAIMMKIMKEVMYEENLERQRKIENPEPECTEPEWKANRDKCTGCVKRNTAYGNLGCEHCDKNWDLPDLIHYT